MAVAQYLKTAGIPQITYNPSPPTGYEGADLLVGTGGTTMQPGSVMGDYLAKTAGWTTLNTLTSDDSAGRAFMEPLTTIFTAEGGKVLKQQWVPDDVGDFSPYLTTLPAADGMAVWEPGGSAIKFFIQWVATGTSKKLPVAAAFHGGFTDPFIPAALPANVAKEVVERRRRRATLPTPTRPRTRRSRRRSHRSSASRRRTTGSLVPGRPPWCSRPASRPTTATRPLTSWSPACSARCDGP